MPVRQTPFITRTANFGLQLFNEQNSLGEYKRRGGQMSRNTGRDHDQPVDRGLFFQLQDSGFFYQGHQET